MQRKWFVGDKFGDGGAAERFPPFNHKWVAHPARRRRHDIPFAPKPCHNPVGNAKDYSESSLLRIWLLIFEEAAAEACSYTNKVGMARYGADWQIIDWTMMLQFHCCLFRMSIHSMSSLKEYFSRKNGDPVIRSIGLSGRQFMRIYAAFTLYSYEEAAREGYSDRENLQKFDSLFKIRPVWNTAMKAFQACRNPPKDLSLDEVGQ